MIKIAAQFVIQRIVSELCGINAVVGLDLGYVFVAAEDLDKLSGVVFFRGDQRDGKSVGVVRRSANRLSCLAALRLRLVEHQSVLQHKIVAETA